MKVLIFGASGMLGHKLVQVLGKQFDVTATIRGKSLSFRGLDLPSSTELIPGVDVTDTLAVASVIENARPDVVINAAGIVKQVLEARSVVATLLINSIFPHRLAELSSKFGYRLITISTDCVFSGKKGSYSEDDLPDAHDLYGKSKQFGEIGFGNALTLRTSLIGRELGSHNGLIEWMLANRGGRIKGYTKAIFSGFPTVVLADIIAKLINEHEGISGLFHLSSDPISKYDLLDQYKNEFDVDVEIEPFGEFKIDRSLDSSRFRSATGITIPEWPELIAAMRKDPMIYENPVAAN